ncbi:MAG: TatD family hydrolase [Spirochaetaceae bacterium]|jgi:TatD DNase family protein|nr:TatD family hydrolase [Spirochaetaceae bacterium]
MLSDAHAHPFDLSRLYGGAEAERRRLNIICAASAWRAEEFLYNERAASVFPMALCFAVHPQLPASGNAARDSKPIQDSLSFMYKLAGEKRIDAVGETGFDLYNDEFRATEKIQDELFEHHLCIAEKHELPLVLHLRRAEQKIFSYTKRLKKITSVVFHSYQGTADEAAALLRRGVNAYFSFGTTILLNHKKAMKSCAALEAERLLFETDAPYQSLRGNAYSSYADINSVIQKASELRSGAEQAPVKADELAEIAGMNFYAVYKKRLNDETGRI